MSSLTGSYGLGLIIEAKNKASKVFRQVQGDFNRFTASQQSNLVKMRSWSNQMGQNYSRMRMGMMKDLQIVAGGAALAAPLIMVGKAAADSEMRLANVKSLLVTEMGPAEVEKSMGKIRDAIFKTGHDSMIPLTQMEVAMYDLKSADLSVDEAIGALPATAKLAVAGLGTMDEAVKYQTAILNTYGKSWGDVMVPAEKAGKIANITANTIAGFKTTLPELSEAMQYAAGPANALRVEFAELTSTIGALQTAGLKGTLAGTALSAFYRSATRLVSQSGEEYNGAEISAERYFKLQEQGAKTVAKSSLANLDLIDSTGKLKPLPDILEIVEKRFNINAGQAKELAKQGISVVDGMAKMNISAKEAAVLQKDFGDQGSRALMMLMGQSDALREKIIVTAESNNLDKMVAARQDTLIGKLRMTKNRFQELAITIGGTVIGDIDTGGVNSTLEGITEFAKEHPMVVGGIGKIVGAVAGLTISFGALKMAGRMMEFSLGWIPGITRGMGILQTAVRGVGFALSKLFIPLALTAAVVELDKQFHKFGIEHAQGEVSLALDQIQEEQGMIARLKKERELESLSPDQQLLYMQTMATDEYGEPLALATSTAGDMQRQEIEAMVPREIPKMPEVSVPQPIKTGDESLDRMIEFNRQAQVTHKSEMNIEKIVIENKAENPIPRELAEQMLNELNKLQAEQGVLSEEGEM